MMYWKYDLKVLSQNPLKSLLSNSLLSSFQIEIRTQDLQSIKLDK
jgi:uncharacterized ubiquitin-like protein YukD